MGSILTGLGGRSDIKGLLTVSMLDGLIGTGGLTSVSMLVDVSGGSNIKGLLAASLDGLVGG
jgi:hypothetical protein